ncbi:hypothetical protein ACEN2D_02045 [Corynebacterium auriscanis]|uniref:hypothetical protein n=1 Tax=Corynebacterium auriscanis TaxID=99807 RepID=UPI0024ACA612|nr:hypothetical protein [Corynebacterium auriscanis]
MSKTHPLIRVFRWGRIAVVLGLTSLAAHFWGAFTLELDLVSSVNGRSVVIGELTGYVGVFVIAAETCRPHGTWEMGWRRSQYRAVVSGAVLFATGTIPSLICAHSLVEEFGAEVRWWVPLLNALIISAVTLLSSRVIASPHFLAVPLAIIVVILTAQTLHVPGSERVFLAGYNPQISPGVNYWIVFTVATLLFICIPIGSIDRLVKTAGYR